MTREYYNQCKEPYEFLLLCSEHEQSIGEKIVLAIKQEDITGLEKNLQSIDVQTLNTKIEKFGFIAHVACEIGNMKIIKILTKAGCDFTVSAEDTNSLVSTSLEVACYADNITEDNGNKRIEVMKYLIDEVKISITDRAVHNSLYCQDVKIPRLLLDKGGNPDALGFRGITPLLILINHISIRKKTLEIIKLLLDYGADILKHEEFIGNSLHLAAERGHVEVGTLLIEHAKKNGLLYKLLQPSPTESYCQILCMDKN